MFENIVRQLERHLDPAVARRKADFLSQQAEMGRFASVLFEVLHNHAYSCFNALVSGTIPNQSERARILLSTGWIPNFDADPPLTRLDRATVRVYKLSDNPLQLLPTDYGVNYYPKPVRQLELDRKWQEYWDLEETDYTSGEWPIGIGRAIEEDPGYVKSWVECAREWS